MEKGSTGGKKSQSEAFFTFYLVASSKRLRTEKLFYSCICRIGFSSKTCMHRTALSFPCGRYKRCEKWELLSEDNLFWDKTLWEMCLYECDQEHERCKWYVIRSFLQPIAFIPTVKHTREMYPRHLLRPLSHLLKETGLHQKLLFWWEGKREIIVHSPMLITSLSLSSFSLRLSCHKFAHTNTYTSLNYIFLRLSSTLLPPPLYLHS